MVSEYSLCRGLPSGDCGRQLLVLCHTCNGVHVVVVSQNTQTSREPRQQLFTSWDPDSQMPLEAQYLHG